MSIGKIIQEIQKLLLKGDTFNKIAISLVLSFLLKIINEDIDLYFWSFISLLIFLIVMNYKNMYIHLRTLYENHKVNKAIKSLTAEEFNVLRDLFFDSRLSKFDNYSNQNISIDSSARKELIELEKNFVVKEVKHSDLLKMSNPTRKKLDIIYVRLVESINSNRNTEEEI